MRSSLLRAAFVIAALFPPFTAGAAQVAHPVDGARAIVVRPAGIAPGLWTRPIAPIGDEGPSASEGAFDPERPAPLEDAPARLGGRELAIDTHARLDPIAASFLSGFEGQPQYYSVPYDAAIAASPTQILVVTNNQFGVYDKATGALLASDLHIRFFGQEAGGGYDPKCFYDPAAQRFVMIALEVAENPDRGLIDVAVSQTADASGAWYRYLFDATMIAPDSSLTWADFPGLGFDDQRVYLSTNQLAFRDSMAFRFSRVRVWNKQELYSGGPVTHVDFAPIRNADGSEAFAIKPARPLEPTSTGRLFATRARGASHVSTWTVTGTWPDLVLGPPTTVAVGAYARGRDAPQPGSSKLIDTRDCRTHDVVWHAGRLYTAFNERFGADSSTSVTALRYLEVGDDGLAHRDVTYAAPGSFLFYPAVSVDSAGNAAMVFGRCSAVEYASIYHARLARDGAFEPSGRLAAGIAPIETDRWGDYNAAVSDPADPNVVWLYAGFGALNGRWGSWIAATTPSQAGPPLSVELEDPTGNRTFLALSVAPQPGAGAHIAVQLSRPATVRFSLHDVSGRRVRRWPGAAFAAGRTALEWDGRDDSGARARPGVYWLRAEADREAVSRRIVVLE